MEAQWRLDLARRFPHVWSVFPGLAAVPVGGPVARGLAADLEIGVFWHAPPSNAERIRLLQSLDVTSPRSFPYFPDEDLWLDQGQLGGVRLDLSHRTVEGVEAGLCAVHAEQQTGATALNAIGVLRWGASVGRGGAEALAGTGRRLSPSPAVAVIGAHLGPTPVAWLRQHLA